MSEFALRGILHTAMWSAPEGTLQWLSGHSLDESVHKRLVVAAVRTAIDIVSTLSERVQPGAEHGFGVVRDGSWLGETSCGRLVVMVGAGRWWRFG